jgi:hypothetical protein
MALVLNSSVVNTVFKINHNVQLHKLVLKILFKQYKTINIFSIKLSIQMKILCIRKYQENQ